MLTLEKVDAFYGAAQALHKVSLSVRPGEVLAVARSDAPCKVPGMLAD